MTTLCFNRVGYSDAMLGGKLDSRSEPFNIKVYRIFSALALMSDLELVCASDRGLVLPLSIPRLDRFCRSKLRLNNLSLEP